MTKKELNNYSVPSIKIRALFYFIALIHMPWTIVRVLFALTIKIDSWCDKTIHGFLNEN